MKMEDLYNLLDENQKKEVGVKILKKIEESVEQVDTKMVAKKITEFIVDVVCQEDYIVDSFDMDSIFDDMNELIKKALRQYIEKGK